MSEIGKCEQCDKLAEYEMLTPLNAKGQRYCKKHSLDQDAFWRGLFPGSPAPRFREFATGDVVSTDKPKEPRT